MKKIFLTLAMICIILTACGEPKNIPTVFPSVTPKPSLTATATLTTTPTIAATPTETSPTQPPPTPTFTPFPPYPNKKVVFEYYTTGDFIGGDDSYFQLFYADYYHLFSSLILYDDGQMVGHGGQKVLSADEMRNFFSKLDTLGFFSLESNQQHDPTDKLYNYGNNYQKSFDGGGYCVMVNMDKSRNLCVYRPDLKFVIPKMKNILNFLDNYKPTGLTPYYPDRILLSTRLADPAQDDLSVSAILWDKRFPSLDFSLRRTSKYNYDMPVSIVYIQGDMAKEIDLFLENSHSHGVFIQNGKKYIVHEDIVWPHETVINAYQ